MDAWIPITIAAAAAQTLRFMAQRHLRVSGLSTSGATLARFVFSAPVVAVAVWAYATATGQGLPALTPRFWGFALAGGIAQILATMCVVALFSERNFAVGITFKKTEVMLTAVAGFVVLGDAVSAAGALALLVGFAAVLLLSEAPGATGPWHRRVLTRAAGLGVASGVFFAISAVGYRGAVLALPSGDVALRAGVTLALVTAVQTAVMIAWMRWREPGQVTQVLRSWRVVALVGGLSVLGSYGWFTAFALQSAAYVFALGQVELVFSILASVLVFGERIRGREYAGMALLAVSVVVLVAAA